MTINWHQKSFSTGALNPFALGRSDTAQYTTALKRCENAFILSQGSIMKRWGLKKYPTSAFEDHSTLQSLGSFPFDFNDGNFYCIIAAVFSIQPDIIWFYIYKNDVISTIASYGSRFTELDSIFKASELSYAQYGDRLIFCHGLLKPFYLQRSLDNKNNEIFLVKELSFDSLPKDQDKATTDAWSNEKGWPEVCCFYENRFYLASTKTYPQTLWGSKSGLFFDFLPSSSLTDDDAVEITLQGNKLNKINYVHNGNQLVILTSAGEWYNTAKPITPKNIGEFRLFSEFGSSQIKPSFIDNALVYHERNSNTIRIIQWDYQLDALATTSLDYLGGHLVNLPISVTAWRGSGKLSVNYVFVVNKDGTVAVIGLDLSQQILNWSIWKFPYPCVSCVTGGGEIVFVLKSSDSVYLGRLDPSAKFDLQSGGVFRRQYFIQNINPYPGYDTSFLAGDMYYTGDGPATNLIQEEIAQRLDDKYIYDGIPIPLEIETLPVTLIPEGRDSDLKQKRTRILRLVLEATLGYVVEYLGRSYVPLEATPSFDFNSPIPPFSGEQEFFLDGYAKNATIKISQKVPYGLTILSINQEIY